MSELLTVSAELWWWASLKIEIRCPKWIALILPLHSDSICCQKRGSGYIYDGTHIITMRESADGGRPGLLSMSDPNYLIAEPLIADRLLNRFSFCRWEISYDWNSLIFTFFKKIFFRRYSCFGSLLGIFVSIRYHNFRPFPSDSPVISGNTLAMVIVGS